jgi:hypothetical protein
MGWWKNRTAEKRAAKDRLAQARAQHDADVALGTETWITSGEWRAWDAPAILIAGTKQHVDVLPPIAGRSTESHRCVLRSAVLARDVDNTSDPNAIAVSIGMRVVGWVDRPRAARLAPLMDREGLADPVTGVPVALLIGTVTDVQDDASSDGVAQVQAFGLAMWVEHESMARRFPPALWGGDAAPRAAWALWRDRVHS